MAVFFALVVKKPDQGEFQITEEAQKLAEDEDFLLQSSLNRGQERSKKTKLLPPDQARLIAMRTARMKERKMYSVIREVITYYFFLTLLLTIAYTHRSPVGYLQTRNIINTMAGNFSKVSLRGGPLRAIRGQEKAKSNIALPLCQICPGLHSVKCMPTLVSVTKCPLSLLVK